MPRRRRCWVVYPAALRHPRPIHPKQVHRTWGRTVEGGLVTERRIPRELLMERRSRGSSEAPDPARVGDGAPDPAGVADRASDPTAGASDPTDPRSPPVPAAIRASTAPTDTVVSIGTTISATTPWTGAGTSVSILSVEISQIVSSAAIRSPTSTRQATIVPSATDTPIWGIVTSTIVVPAAAVFAAVPPVAAAPAAPGRRRRRRRR